MMAWGIIVSLSGVGGDITGDNGKWYKARRMTSVPCRYVVIVPD
jgi:hypothetical protein